MAKINVKVDEVLVNLQARMAALEVLVAEEFDGKSHPVHFDGNFLFDLANDAYGGYNVDRPYQPATYGPMEVEPGVTVTAEAKPNKVDILLQVQRGLRWEQAKLTIPKSEVGNISVVEFEVMLQEKYRWCCLAIGQQRRLAMDRAERRR